MFKIKIKPLNDELCNQIPGNQIPLKAHETDSGYDLRAWTEEPIELNFAESKLVPCGFSMELPEEVEAQIRPRSGLAVNYGITVLNSPGTIDSSYRGEVKVLLINFGEKPFVVTPGMRIAQMVFGSVLKTELKVVSELSKTERNSGGFGSTGA
jgi:dUTP pyrophosphatase